VPSDFHLFGPLREVPEGKWFRANDEVKLVQQWLNGQPQSSLGGAARMMVMVYGSERVCRKIGITFEKKLLIDFY
jgi:hypothetical protein